MTIADDPFASLAAALVDAQDQLLALYELATMTSESLDRATCVDPILDRATSILEADELVFSTEGFSEALADGHHVVDLAIEGGDDHVGLLRATRSASPFGTADRKLLRAVAHMALSAVRTAEMHEDAIGQAIVRKDHDAASQLAVLALPKWRPSIDGLSFFARTDPAKTAGGDLFTFAEDGPQLHFVVGDVSGKGLPAAMVMSTIISAANAALNSHGEDPVRTLREIDTWVYDYLDTSGLFCTIIAGSINAETGLLRVANAGHSPVVLVRDGVPEMLEASAPPIGVLPLEVTALNANVHQLSPNDRFVVCSDGFTEQVDPDGHMYGEDRLMEQLADPTRVACDHGDALFETLDAFGDGAPQSDDRTLVLVDYRNQRATDLEEAA